MLILTASLPDLLPEGAFAALGQRAQYEVLQSLAEAARTFWIRTAGAALHTTKRDYIAGIQAVQMRQGVATIALVGQMPNFIEHGMEAMDLHDTLLGSDVPVVPRGERGKHRKKDGSGFYRAIPFRHATPGTSGATGAAMGSAYGGHPEVEAGFVSGGQALIQGSEQLGSWIYQVAKKLKATKGMPGGPVQYGGRLPASLAPKLREHHATDIYAGMIKSRKTYEKATQSQYTTFRTIATGSPGWQRKATPGRHFIVEVDHYLARVAGRSIEAYLRAQTKGTP